MRWENTCKLWVYWQKVFDIFVLIASYDEIYLTVETQVNLKNTSDIIFLCWLKIYIIQLTIYSIFSWYYLLKYSLLVVLCPLFCDTWILGWFKNPNFFYSNAYHLVTIWSVSKIRYYLYIIKIFITLNFKLQNWSGVPIVNTTSCELNDITILRYHQCSMLWNSILQQRSLTKTCGGVPFSKSAYCFGRWCLDNKMNFGQIIAVNVMIPKCYHKKLTSKRIDKLVHFLNFLNFYNNIEATFSGVIFKYNLDSTTTSPTNSLKERVQAMNLFFFIQYLVYITFFIYFLFKILSDFLLQKFCDIISFAQENNYSF